MRMVEWQYTQQTCDDAARWASINMVICLAYEYRFSNNMKPEKDREKARLYFKNAISVFTELSIRRTDLLSVQSLLSMVRRSVLTHLALTDTIFTIGVLSSRKFGYPICIAVYHRSNAIMSTDGTPS